MCYSSVYIWYRCNHQTTRCFPRYHLYCGNKWCLCSSSHAQNRHIDTNGICTCIRMDSGEGEQEIYNEDMKCDECS